MHLRAADSCKVDDRPDCIDDPTPLVRRLLCLPTPLTEHDKDETEIHVKTNPSDFVVSLELSAAAFAEVCQQNPSHTHACAHTCVEM